MYNGKQKYSVYDNPQNCSSAFLEYESFYQTPLKIDKFFMECRVDMSCYTTFPKSNSLFNLFA